MVLPRRPMQCNIFYLSYWEEKKKIVLLRTILSSNGRPSEWKFEDASAVFVTCVRAA